MSKTERYYQCTLAYGQRQTVAFIPEEGARMGAKMKLTDSEDPTLEWKVTSVSSMSVTSDNVKKLQLLNRNSLPSIL